MVQFLYDLWWGHITPDTDFPKDVRRVLNSAFGELAVRAQQADLKRMLLTYACCLHQKPARMPAACIDHLHVCLLLVSATCTYACCLYQPPARMPAACIGHLHPPCKVHDTMLWCMHQHVLACVMDVFVLCILCKAQRDRSNDVSAQPVLSP